MTDDFRPILGPDRTPIQQSLTMHPADHTNYSMNKLLLGIIIDVYPSDDPRNRSAQQSVGFHGQAHECKVLIVDSDGPNEMLVDHVIVPPSCPSGIDNYYEQFPRPSTNLIDGEDMSSAMAGVDPYKLDGDWCVIGFLGSNLDQPFIVSWWPHTKNKLDPATSGQGFPGRNNNPQALDQSRRYFHRINGVEYVITKKGDIYFSTQFTNSSLHFSDDNSPTEGRWPRSVDEDVGGSIYMSVKPTQTLEVSWDKVQEGQGIRGRNEPYLPQTNPPPTSRTQSNQEKENTFVKVDQNSVSITVPEDLDCTSKQRISISSDDEATVEATNMLELLSDSTVEIEASSINLGANASDAIILGSSRITDESTFLTAFSTFINAVSGAGNVGAIAGAASTFSTPLQNWANSISNHLSDKVQSE